MNASYEALNEARKALDAPLFAGLPGDISVSFEFFPPKSDGMMAQLWEVVKTLAPLDPAFVSVTYGAGGTTRDRTHGTVARIISEARLPAAAHLTCVDASKAEVNAVAEAYWEAGFATLSLCAAIWASRARLSCRIPMAIRMPPIWWRG
jgi:methylenetetrahydrofolate reductase (NADPH)